MPTPSFQPNLFVQFHLLGPTEPVKVQSPGFLETISRLYSPFDATRVDGDPSLHLSSPPSPWSPSWARGMESQKVSLLMNYRSSLESTSARVNRCLQDLAGTDVLGMGFVLDLASDENWILLCNHGEGIRHLSHTQSTDSPYFQDGCLSRAQLIQECERTASKALLAFSTEPGFSRSLDLIHAKVKEERLSIALPSPEHSASRGPRF